MSKFVGERAALSHRVSRARDSDDHCIACRVAHRQTVFIRADIKHCDIYLGRLLDNRDEVAQRLVGEAMVAAELCCRLKSLKLSVQEFARIHKTTGIA